MKLRMVGGFGNPSQTGLGISTNHPKHGWKTPLIWNPNQKAFGVAYHISLQLDVLSRANIPSGYLATLSYSWKPAPQKLKLLLLHLTLLWKPSFCIDRCLCVWFRNATSAYPSSPVWCCCGNWWFAPDLRSHESSKPDFPHQNVQCHSTKFHVFHGKNSWVSCCSL